VTEDLYSELLSREEVVWLAGVETRPHSPLASFAGLGEAAGAESPAARGLSGELWNQVFAVLRDPRTRVRVTVPGATHSFVQYFLGGGPEVAGLVGCWLEGDGLRVSFPLSETDVVSLVSQVVFPSPPETAEIDAFVLSSDGLAALGAAVDAIRLQYLTAMAARKPEGEYRLDRVSLAEQNTIGSETTDARWLVPMLRLTGLIPPVTDDGLGRGIAELVEAGLLVAEQDHWRPGPDLLTLSSWWRDPLPAISCETTQFDTGRVLHHEQRVIIRGQGPLCVVHRTGGPAAAMTITIGTVAPLEYFDEMTHALRRATSSEPEFVYVLEPTAVRDFATTTSVAGYLQPGQWYQVEGEAGAWASVKDPNGPLEGWAPAAELYRQIDLSDEVAVIEPEAAPRDVAWEATHTVSSVGLRSWEVPDGATDPIADLAAGVELQATEWRSDWVRVRADNGWEAWVDGRRLVAVAAQAPDPHGAPPTELSSAAARAGPGDPVVAIARSNPVQLVAALAVAVSAFLPWFSDLAPTSDLPIAFLWSLDPDEGVLSIALLILIVGIGAVATVLSKRLNRYQQVAGGIATGIAAVWLIQTFRVVLDWEDGTFGTAVADMFTEVLSIGPWVALAAGIALLVKRPT
jgi:hypothetical protein